MVLMASTLKGRLMCDAHLEKMLEVPSNHPSINTVELFLELKPIRAGDLIDLRDPVENPRKRQKRTQQQQQQQVKDDGVSEPRVVSGLWLEDDTMRVGLCFKDLDEMKKAVDWWSIKRQQKYLVREAEKDVYVFKCVRWGCKWSVSASRTEEEGGLFEITKCNGKHTCYPNSSQDFEVKFLEYEIERVVKAQPMLSTKELDKWWKEKFHYALDDVIEHCAEGFLQRAKEKALKRIYGGWDESFSFMPKLMSTLHSSNGLVVDWRYDLSLSFRSVFWAFSQSIKGFEHCRPVIVVDSKDLGGKYKMKLMIASGFDAVNQFFPLAFAVTREVTVDSWRWFLSRIREKVTQRKGLCLISSHHPDIVSVVNEPESQWQEPWAYHRLCLNNLGSRFCSVSLGYEYMELGFLVEEARLSSQKEEFDSNMKKIKEKNPEAWK
ncbi:unnamed protein product [Microthlaspi erraticum]|uniref:Transposase MuDR plant domain-containing protein n=1 Tax=Microthlaspi erraticum TaxID=1685480 RepID=A0A6D2KL01_9BRAS|nr:unnamed protein product [Microthlaspi erraticum]